MRFQDSGFSKRSLGSLRLDFRQRGISLYMSQSPPKLCKPSKYKFIHQAYFALLIPSRENLHKGSRPQFPSSSKTAHLEGHLPRWPRMAYPASYFGGTVSIIQTSFMVIIFVSYYFFSNESRSCL